MKDHPTHFTVPDLPWRNRSQRDRLLAWLRHYPHSAERKISREPFWQHLLYTVRKIRGEP